MEHYAFHDRCLVRETYRYSNWEGAALASKPGGTRRGNLHADPALRAETPAQASRVARAFPALFRFLLSHVARAGFLDGYADIFSAG